MSVAYGTSCRWLPYCVFPAERPEYGFATPDYIPVRSRALYERYEQMAELAGRDPLTSRWMHDHLDDLDMLGLVGIAKRNEGPSGGQYKVVSLEHDLPPVLEALEETIDEVGVHDSIRRLL